MKRIDWVKVIGWPVALVVSWALVIGLAWGLAEGIEAVLPLLR